MRAEPTGGNTLTIIAATKSVVPNPPQKDLATRVIQSNAEKAQKKSSTGMLEKTSSPRPKGMVRQSNEPGVGGIIDVTGG